MSQTEYEKDRRNTLRFQVGWELSVKGIDRTGEEFNAAGTLKDLSARGAFFHFYRSVATGDRLELRVRVPLKHNNWMSYAAQVVRVEQFGASSGVAVRFDGARPEFLKF